MIQKRIEIDLRKVFYYPLSHVPWSLASVAGGIIKTKMSTLKHKLEMGNRRVDTIRKSYSSVNAGIALLCMSSYIGLRYKFFDDNMKFVSTTSSGTSRINMVFDVYRPGSIKNAETSQWPVRNLQLKSIVGAVPIIQWGAVLSHKNNKIDMVKFLEHYCESHPSII